VFALRVEVPEMLVLEIVKTDWLAIHEIDLFKQVRKVVRAMFRAKSKR
jgi:hypothetical protein